MINVNKLHLDLEAAGIPIDGVSSDGRIDFRPETTAKQIALAEQIVADHDPDAQTPEELGLEAARQKAEANLVNADDIAKANTVVALREQVLKMQAQIEYLLIQVKNLSP